MFWGWELLSWIVLAHSLSSFQSLLIRMTLSSEGSTKEHLTWLLAVLSFSQTVALKTVPCCWPKSAHLQSCASRSLQAGHRKMNDGRKKCTKAWGREVITYSWKWHLIPYETSCVHGDQVWYKIGERVLYRCVNSWRETLGDCHPPRFSLVCNHWEELLTFFRRLSRL